jgi:hypothetical protein
VRESLGILSFVSRTVASLPWHVAVLACVVLLCRYLAALIPLVREKAHDTIDQPRGGYCLCVGLSLSV